MEEELTIHDFEEIDSNLTNFSKVYKVLRKSNNDILFAKVPFLEEEESPKNKNKKLLSTFQIMKSLNNPALIKITNFFTQDFDDESRPVIIMEYAENGDLLTMFNKIRTKSTPQRWNNTKVVINILGISLGMSYLNQQNLIHTKLKPSNILLDSNLYPKITDYFYHLVPVKYPTDLAIVTDNGIIYRSPEQSEDEFLDYSTDVYSFGMILYEFYTQTPPTVRGKTGFLILQSIMKGERPNTSSIGNKYVKDLIEKCWNAEKSERPNFEEIICDFIFRKNDFWPDGVDEYEVDEYLHKFGLSIDPDKILKRALYGNGE